MTAATDYARAVAFFNRSRLPAYVSFIETSWARGIGGARQAPQRLFVRTSDGAILSGVPPAGGRVLSGENGERFEPFGKHRFFKPHCYDATSENPTHWNGIPAVRFRLASRCSGDSGISELYADPQTLRPIAVDGDVTDSGNHMTVAIEVRYATIRQYTVPTSIRAHAVGHGWLFWARERAEVDYSGYRFYSTPISRRQSAKRG